MSRPGPHRPARNAGFTLIELTVAIAVVGLFVGMAVTATNAITDAELRTQARELMGAIKYNYDRAIMLRRTQRIAFDLDQGLWWVEYTESPFALSAEKKSAEAAKKAAEAGGDSKLTAADDDEELDDVAIAMAGGQAAPFQTDDPDEVGKPHTLPSGIRLGKVWTGSQEEPFESGLAHLHFFRGGFTEPALIELRDDDDDVITIEVQPLTGRVKSRPEPIEDVEPEDQDDGRAEGDE